MEKVAEADEQPRSSLTLLQRMGALTPATSRKGSLNRQKKMRPEPDEVTHPASVSKKIPVQGWSSPV
jgi:hypothetical protein